MKLAKVILTVCFLSFLGCPAVFACKYNVRDVGFVDLENQPYGFFCYINDSTEKHVADDFKELASAELSETNIRALTINVDQTPDHLALQHHESETRIFPVFVLVSTNREAITIKPIEKGKDFKESLQKVFKKVVFSPMRKEIAEITIEAFGVVLIVEGPDAEENKKAVTSAQAAVKQIAGQMKWLPKHIAKPPEMLIVSREQQRQEEILLWSMGIDINNITQPHAVVLYGRGRRMGPTLSGKNLTKEILTKFLSVIGADCECGLDRSWMQGNMMPTRWSRSQLEILSRQLGFDTENPMVKIEMSQIIRKGNRSNKKEFDLNELEGFNLGYQEFEIKLDPPPPPEPAQQANSDTASNTPAADVPLVVQPEVYENEFRLFKPLYMIGIAGIIVLAISAYLFISTSGKKQ